MEDNGNRKKKILVRVLIIVGAVFFVLIILPQILKTILIPERGYLPPWENYSKMDLEQDFGIDIYSFKEAEDGMIEGATELYNPGKKEELTDYLTFYIFDNARAARKGMDRFYDFFEPQDIIWESDHEIEGWVREVSDADVCMYIYRSRNMIITCEAAYGNFFSDDKDMADATKKNNNSRKRYEECKKYVNNTFKQ